MDTVYSIISGGLFIATAVVIVLSSYGLARFILDPGNEKDRTFDAAASIAVRLSAMHGLILALVYAQELDDYKGVRNALTEEAVAVADVYNDALRFGDPVAGFDQHRSGPLCLSSGERGVANAGRARGLVVACLAGVECGL